jgi:hypothetical protein
MYLSYLIDRWDVGKEIPELPGHYCLNKDENNRVVEIRNVKTEFRFSLSNFLYNCSFIILGNIDSETESETKDSIKAVLGLIKNLDYTGLIVTSVISSHRDYLINDLGFKLIFDIRSRRTTNQNYLLMKEI